ncbi:hypothetical protein O3M35_005419 [Rhynocoris fuscipes]|uniref:Integrase catalytic domain-containing protein n=1 Tax=Rhynocoris fuscipes TaxID=488301 RepID=A0AAW1DKE1_9HEMI
MSCRSAEDTQVLLGTALAKIKSVDGNWHTCRLLVDPGSQVNFITDSLANKLGLSKQRSRMPISGVEAIHLELVTDLTTESFIATLDRFIARRGLPQCIYSDRGTNFVGAARKLKELYEFLAHNSDSINNHLSYSGIEWSFIPPASPHFGGLWEAAVKSTKRHLLTVTQDHALTFEEFYTLLTRIEAVLNSRPLCSISNDPSDNLDYLTPGHFIIGAPLLARPEDEEIKFFPLKTRWELISKAVRHFWKRWYHEYLHTLTPRKKWILGQDNLKEGSLVILHEPATRPQEWKLARVVEVVPGADGVVRVVRLRTANNILVRPVHKVSPLPCGADFY